MQTTCGMPGALGLEALTTDSIGRNISSTCNSSGTVTWALVKNIKPLVDANCHKEAIEFAYHRSSIFSPIHYRDPGSKSHSPSGQTILFGRPLELYTVGELKKIPPILEYLLDSVQDWSTPHSWFLTVCQKHGNCTADSLYTKMEKYWPLANELEQVWTGVEKSDRAIISRLLYDHTFLVMVCPLRCTIQKAKRPCRDIF